MSHCALLISETQYLYFNKTSQSHSRKQRHVDAKHSIPEGKLPALQYQPMCALQFEVATNYAKGLPLLFDKELIGMIIFASSVRTTYRLSTGFWSVSL